MSRSPSWQEVARATAKRLQTAPHGQHRVILNQVSSESGYRPSTLRSLIKSLQFLDEHPERPDSRFTSPFIQYLDLLDGVGRNKELAREYRERVLKLGEPDHD